MPRRKRESPPDRRETVVDCFAFGVTSNGSPHCAALREIYCLTEDKPCPFRATPEEARLARLRAVIRLGEVRQKEATG